jgi:DNA-binding PadR family transcriptional regulator
MTRRDIGFASFPLDYLVIGLLTRGPNHGYQLYQAYVEGFGPIWMVGRSKFYAALNNLHAGGLLDVTTEPQDDRPPRKIYALTEPARQQFDTWLRQPVTPVRAIRVELIAKLRFFNLLGIEGAERLIDAQIAVCRDELARWQQSAEQHHAKGGDRFFDIMYQFRQRQAAFIIDWLTTIRERMVQA